MTQLYVPGPIQFFSGTGAASAYEHVGYCENEFGVRFDASYEDVLCDASGPYVPIDVQYFGEEAFLSATLTKYNEAILQKLAKRATGFAGTSPGSMVAGELGALMLSEGAAYPLLLYCPYVTKSVFSSTMVPGYVFNSAYLAASFEVPLNTRVKRPRVVFRAIPNWTTTSNTSILFSNTMPNPLPTPN